MKLVAEAAYSSPGWDKSQKKNARKEEKMPNDSGRPPSSLLAIERLIGIEELRRSIRFVAKQRDRTRSLCNRQSRIRQSILRDVFRHMPREK